MNNEETRKVIVLLLKSTADIEDRADHIMGLINRGENSGN
jgi:hypothetical protein